MTTASMRADRPDGRPPSGTLYVLYAKDARSWHEHGGNHFDDCWCAADEATFLDRLAERLRAASFEARSKRDHLVLSGGPGMDEMDDTLLRRSVETGR